MSMYNEATQEQLVALLDLERCAHVDTKKELKDTRAELRVSKNSLKITKNALDAADKDRDAVEEKLAKGETMNNTLRAEKNWLVSRTMPTNGPARTPNYNADMANENERLKTKIASLELTASLQSATEIGQHPPAIFNFAPHLNIGHVANLNVTVQNSIPLHPPAVASTTPVVEELDAADSLSLSGLAIDDIKLSKYKSPCTGCKGTECPFLHPERANKLPDQQIAALPANRKADHQAKRKDL